MSDVRTFRAASMDEALGLVREELGNDAVILHTRQIARKRLLPWRRPIEEVEITATLTLNTPKSSAPSRPQGRTAESRPTATRSRATTAPGRASRLDLVSEPAESLIDVLKGPPPVRRSAEPPVVRGNRFSDQDFGAATTRPAEADPTAALARRLDSIQQMLQELGRVRVDRRRDEIPSDLFHLYTDLIDADVDEDVAQQLIFQLKRTASPRQLADRAAAKSLLTAMVEAEIRCCEPISVKPGRRKVVALIGATGVGKTTTIAKLAANFRLRSGVKMGLVTVDTYRVAAVEQLRTYAEIIDLPMRVVTNPIEMRRSLDELAGMDLVLIDTAGRSPKDELQIQELKSLLAEAHADEVHLVLSMTSSLRSLKSAAANFRSAGVTAMILTKLDECSGMGALLSAARGIELPISYLTAGQAVPDDIEPAHPARIARLVLGQERIAS